MTDAAHLFISDLHLDAAAPAAVEQFLRFLATEAAQAQSLYILGDLFEVWVGDDDEEPARQRVCEALLRLTRGGVPCFVVRGNRDFLFGAGFEARTGCRLLPDPLLATFGAQRVFVSHGDVLCTDDHSYQELRSVVRDPEWQDHFLALPLATRRVVADAARAGSKAHTQAVQRAIMDVNPAAVITAFRVSGTRLMIHGHTHRPGIFQHEVDGEPAIRIVLGDWYDQGSVLVFRDDGRYELRNLAR
ncbi:MAG: UDP-2,3-diacylglucosamine diphosphatase [Pseudomonadota bacterium]